MANHNDRRHGIPVRTPVSTEEIAANQGIILGNDGQPIALAGQYGVSPGEPREDEIVYHIKEAHVGPLRLGLEPRIKLGFVMCTFVLEGGTGEDMGLVILRGVTPPPPGTRFTLRMLGPKTETQEDGDGGKGEATSEQAGSVPPAPETTETPARQEEEPRAGWQSRFPEAASILERGVDLRRNPGG